MRQVHKGQTLIIPSGWSYATANRVDNICAGCLFWNPYALEDMLQVQAMEVALKLRPPMLSATRALMWTLAAYYAKQLKGKDGDKWLVYDMAPFKQGGAGGPALRPTSSVRGQGAAEGSVGSRGAPNYSPMGRWSMGYQPAPTTGPLASPLLEGFGSKAAAGKGGVEDLHLGEPAVPLPGGGSVPAAVAAASGGEGGGEQQGCERAAGGIADHQLAAAATGGTGAAVAASYRPPAIATKRRSSDVGGTAPGDVLGCAGGEAEREVKRQRLEGAGGAARVHSHTARSSSWGHPAYYQQQKQQQQQRRHVQFQPHEDDTDDEEMQTSPVTHRHRELSPPVMLYQQQQPLQQIRGASPPIGTGAKLTLRIKTQVAKVGGVGGIEEGTGEAQYSPVMASGTTGVRQGDGGFRSRRGSTTGAGGGAGVGTPHSTAAKPGKDCAGGLSLPWDKWAAEDVGGGGVGGPAVVSAVGPAKVRIKAAKKPVTPKHASLGPAHAAGVTSAPGAVAGATAPGLGTTMLAASGLPPMTPKRQAAAGVFEAGPVAGVARRGSEAGESCWEVGAKRREGGEVPGSSMGLSSAGGVASMGKATTGKVLRRRRSDIGEGAGDDPMDEDVKLLSQQKQKQKQPQEQQQQRAPAATSSKRRLLVDEEDSEDDGDDSPKVLSSVSRHGATAPATIRPAQQQVLGQTPGQLLDPHLQQQQQPSKQLQPTATASGGGVAGKAAAGGVGAGKQRLVIRVKMPSPSPQLTPVVATAADMPPPLQVPPAAVPLPSPAAIAGGSSAQAERTHEQQQQQQQQHIPQVDGATDSISWLAEASGATGDRSGWGSHSAGTAMWGARACSKQPAREQRCRSRGTSKLWDKWQHWRLVRQELAEQAGVDGCSQQQQGVGASGGVGYVHIPQMDGAGDEGSVLVPGQVSPLGSQPPAIRPPAAAAPGSIAAATAARRARPLRPAMPEMIGPPVWVGRAVGQAAGEAAAAGPAVYVANSGDRVPTQQHLEVLGSKGSSESEAAAWAGGQGASQQQGATGGLNVVFGEPATQAAPAAVPADAGQAGGLGMFDQTMQQQQQQRKIALPPAAVAAGTPSVSGLVGKEPVEVPYVVEEVRSHASGLVNPLLAAGAGGSLEAGTGNLSPNPPPAPSNPELEPPATAVSVPAVGNQQQYQQPHRPAVAVLAMPAPHAPPGLAIAAETPEAAVPSLEAAEAQIRPGAVAASRSRLISTTGAGALAVQYPGLGLLHLPVAGATAKPGGGGTGVEAADVVLGTQQQQQPEQQQVQQHPQVRPQQQQQQQQYYQQQQLVPLQQQQQLMPLPQQQQQSQQRPQQQQSQQYQQQQLVPLQQQQSQQQQQLSPLSSSMGPPPTKQMHSELEGLPMLLAVLQDQLTQQRTEDLPGLKEGSGPLLRHPAEVLEVLAQELGAKAQEARLPVVEGLRAGEVPQGLAEVLRKGGVLGAHGLVSGGWNYHFEGQGQARGWRGGGKGGCLCRVV